MFTSAPLDQKESAALEEKIKNYKCSITEQIFLEPVSATECRHTFEKSALDRWKEEGHHDCPNCRALINENNQFHPSPLLTVEAIDQFLEAHPEYYDERYFNLDLFVKVLFEGESPRLRNMIKALHHSSVLLNEMSLEEKTAGLSPLYYLSIHKTGIKELFRDADLRKNITAENFNKIIEKGPDQGKSIAYILAATDAGRQVLLKDSALCRKISFENLNKIRTQGSDRGRSILYHLASTETGRKILSDNLYLIGQMSDATLQMKMPDGDDRGRSATEWLKNTDSGRHILNQKTLLAAQGKYIVDHGRLQLNPTKNKNRFDESITIVSSVNDTFEAKNAFQIMLGRPMELSDATISSLDIIQDSRFTDEFNTKVAPGEIVDRLTESFADYQIPLGLINKLLQLSEFHIQIIISDDDSMQTQWNTLENRMHQLVNLLTYVTAESITIEFLNRKEKLILNHTGETLEQYKRDAHAKIVNLFAIKPAGPVPLFAKMKELNGGENTARYFYLNATPTDLPTDTTLAMLLQNRKSPESNPMTWINCNDEVSDWSFGMDASFTKAIQPYEIMKKEVLRTQGPGFPFNHGIWLVCQLVAAMNPKELSFSPGAPYPQKTLDNFLGRKLTKEEYRYYFDAHPLGRKKEYQDQFKRYAIVDAPTLTLEQKKAEPVQQLRLK